MALDPALREWATEIQWQRMEAVDRLGSHRAAATELGVHHSAIDRSVGAVKQKAAAGGYAPGHWTDGVAPGFRMGKVTVQRANGVVERTWERQHPEGEHLEALIARCDERLKDFPRFAPVPTPLPATSPLTNFLGLFDLHIGEKISSDDPAGRWDIDIAKRTITASVAHAISVAPKARRLVLCFGGDAIHYDGLMPVTPKSRHVLHSDGDFDDMVDAVLDVAVFSIDRALETHEVVYLIWAEGNHDEASSVWMALQLYSQNNARISSLEQQPPTSQTVVVRGK